MEVDHRNEKMGAKIRDFTLQKLPYILIVGDKEAETGGISLRVRGQGDQGAMPLEDFVTRARSWSRVSQPVCNALGLLARAPLERRATMHNECFRPSRVLRNLRAFDILLKENTDVPQNASTPKAVAQIP